MSRENVEVVRHVWDAAARGDAAAVLALYDADVVWDVSRGPLGGLAGSGVYHGHAGLSSFFRSWRQAWDDVDYELDELIDAGEHVITVGRQRGRGRASGIGFEGAGQSAVWTVRDGKIASVVWYPSREAATEAVGRPE